MRCLSSRRILSECEEETLLIGETMSAYSFPGMVFLLEGDIGAGKTTLVRGFCRAEGCTGVRSPSFTLVNHYTGRKGAIIHSDFYRLDTVDPTELPLEDYLDEQSVLFVEWAERGVPGDFRNIWCIRFDYEDETCTEEQRVLEFSARGEKAEEALRSFFTALKELMKL